MSEPTPLNPLLMLRAITKDTRFTASESRFLSNAVLHTDNDSRKVRYSIGATAREVEVSGKTGSRAIRKAEESGYFANVNRYRTKDGTVVDVWFKSLPPTGQQDGRVGEATGQEDGRVPTGQATGQEDGPSTPSTPYFYRASDLAVPFLADEEATGQENGRVEKKPCGCTPGLSCPTCRGDVVRPQRHPDFKLKGWHDDHLERDEALNEYGEPLGIDY